MGLADHLRRLLAYHGWAYSELIRALQALPETQYHADCGLFFGSLHGTLNHLVVVDRLWLARVLGEPSPYASLREEAASNLPTLSALLATGVAAWQAQLDNRDDGAIAAPVHYHTMAGDAQSRPLAELVTHLVNHGTHHRGQMSAALTRLGHPAPVLDYIYFPAPPA